MPGVLFVCTGNIFRSPFARAVFASKLSQAGKSGDWMTYSAGTWTVPGQPVPPLMLEAADKFGIDLRDHRTRLVDGDLLASSSLILVMEKGHQEALCIEFPFARKNVHLLSQVVDHLEYDVLDPAVAERETILAIASDLYKLVERGVPAICQLAQRLQNSQP